jgi:hypothetical protein
VLVTPSLESRKVRTNGGPFIGETSQIYNASKGARESLAKFGKRERSKVVLERPVSKAEKAQQPPHILLREIYNGTLKVEGLILGRVDVRSDRMVPGTIPRDVIPMEGNFKGRIDSWDVPARLWKTLIAGKHSNGSDPDLGDKFARHPMLRWADRRGDIHIEDLLLDPPLLGGSTSKNYLELVRDVCWNRRAFLGDLTLDDNELFGLCPDETGIGGLVCIIYGLSVPVILRPWKREVQDLGFKERPPLSRRNEFTHEISHNEQSNPFASVIPGSRKRRRSLSPSSVSGPSILPSLYRLVDECYVDGMMAG